MEVGLRKYMWVSPLHCYTANGVAWARVYIIQPSHM